ncbi:hypothetical protein GGTG_01685 [Gaeumannomyces tritici R3-111a-1]|uniref:Uncharacterized protein n=1 Tax=Gaeumannomyces tritici (strain R3-111a-1) TaxID=644352 RepID=J3NKA5_GAET3|nr:hypothetical protein GGTG_01685 [Gaeumannomyces tritici R3-111a-1]EJT81709.1 hypothetical protein GGTG_01685 [Gaeumannomyces tritici R3-111a-1]
MEKPPNAKKNILKLFIKALKFNCVIIVAAKIISAKSGISRRQYGRRTFTGSRAIFLILQLLSHFLKPFKKFNASFIANYVFAINIFKKPRTIIEAYRYTGVNGIILIYLITKIIATKYRTLRIIVFKKRQINKVLIIALLKIDNFPQRERVTNIYIKRKKGNLPVKFKCLKGTAKYRLLTVTIVKVIKMVIKCIKRKKKAGFSKRYRALGRFNGISLNCTKAFGARKI